MAIILSSIAIILGCMAATVASVLWIESFGLPAARRELARRAISLEEKRASLKVRIAACLLIYAFFFAILWRPVYAWGATLTFYTVWTLISHVKCRIFKESLVFADVMLVPSLLRHKEIFYANNINLLFWAGVLVYIFGGTAFFFAFEPDMLPDGQVWLVALMLVVAFGPWLALFVPEIRSPVGKFAITALGRTNTFIGTEKFGAFTYVLLDFLAWLGFDRSAAEEVSISKMPFIEELQQRFSHDNPPVVLIWQSESFYDMRRAGVSNVSLPVLDAMRARAVRWGTVESIFAGGNTVRTEFSVLTGLSPAEIGPDANYPYLKAAAYALRAWPRAFRALGWKTSFIHPYDRRFFRRDSAIPELGFDDLTMLDDFEKEPEKEVYVSDWRIVRRVLDQCDRHPDQPIFIFVASMENHGPWKPGRVEGAVEPIEIYTRILERTDAALGKLMETFDRYDRPVWMAFYGDHTPLMQVNDKPIEDTRTDFFIVPSGTAPRIADVRVPEQSDPWLLIQQLMESANASSENPK